MNSRTTKKFDEEYDALPETIKRKFDRQVKFLLNNLRHPSLHSKKYDETNDIWQARVDDNYRFYFVIREDSYILLRIKKHPK